MTERKRNQKQAGSEVKTFPVPFSLGEIKENISISINTPSKTSKEEIINQAFKYHQEGNITEAAKYYQLFISQGFRDYRVFSNYGSILKGHGKLEEAEFFTRKAIEIKPDLPEFYSNLGIILKGLGKLKEAEISYRKAIELNPEFATSYYNLGIILKELGKLKEAEISYRKAIKLNPEFATNYYNLGIILKGLGKLKEAETSYRKATELKSDYAEAYLNLGEVLHNLNNVKEAEISVRKALELNPDLFEANKKLAELLIETERNEEANIYEWKAIELKTLSPILKTYRNDAELINKTAFYVPNYSVFNHFKPILSINTNFFEILVPTDINNEIIHKIRNDLNNVIRVRSEDELKENKLIYKQLVSIHGLYEYEFIEKKNNIQRKIKLPCHKLFGKKNIRFMYAAGKSKYNINSYWNKYYDGILCFGPYHEDRFKLKHKIPTVQMGYPRFDKYFNPGFNKDYLLEKFKCDPKKKTIVWLATWSNISSVEKYLKEISSLRSEHNIVMRPHPYMKFDDPESYKKLFTVDFNYLDDNEDDNVQLYALADLMLFDYGGPMFGALYLNKNFAFLEMNLEAKNSSYTGKESSEDYLKSFFPDRIAKLKTLKSICNYCLKNPPSNSIMKSLREEFFNTNYQGTSAKRAYYLLSSNKWLG